MSTRVKSSPPVGEGPATQPGPSERVVTRAILSERPGKRVTAAWMDGMLSLAESHPGIEGTYNPVSFLSKSETEKLLKFLMDVLR